MADEVTMQGDQVVMRDEKVGTGLECCCGSCQTVGHCVTITWDLEYLDFVVGCSTPRVFFGAAGSATFYFDPDDPTASVLTCLNGTPIADDTAYKTFGLDESWDIPSGASGDLVISGTIDPTVCFKPQVLLTSEWGTGFEWPDAELVGDYGEVTEDLTGTGDCGADEVSIRGTITMTDTWPSTSEDCACP